MEEYTKNMIFLIDIYGTITWDDFETEDEMLDYYNEYKDDYKKILFLNDFINILDGKYNDLLNQDSLDKIKNIKSTML